MLILVCYASGLNSDSAQRQTVNKRDLFYEL